MNDVSAKNRNSAPAGANGNAEKNFDPVRNWQVCLAALPALLPLYVIFHYHENLVWNDAWDLGELLVRSHHNLLNFADFWTPHNEHRMPVPYLLMFLLARMTAWNQYVELLFGYAMVCLLSGLFALLLKSAVRGRQSWIWPWFLINLLIFSPMQCENWIFGFAACQNMIPIPCLVGAVLLLWRKGVSWPAVLISGLLVEIAAASLANGLLGWFLILPLIAKANSWQEVRRLKWFIVTWIGMAGASLMTQFWGYHSNLLAEHYYSAAGWQRIEYFISFLGTPMNFGSAPSVAKSMLAGLIVVGIYAGFLVAYLRGRVADDMQRAEPMLCWLVLGGYAMGSAVLGALGRAGLGVEQAASSRYTTISMCLLISLIGLLMMTDLMKSAKMTLGAILFLLIGISDCRSIGVYFEAAREHREGMAHLAFIDFVFEPITPMMVSTQEGLRQRADALDALGYLHPPLIKNADVRSIQPQGSGAESSMASSGMVEHGQQTADGTITLRGWAVLPGRRRPADAVLITVQNDIDQQILCAIGDVRTVRDDMAKLLGSDFAICGWQAEFSKLRLPVSPHRLVCWAYDAELQKAYPLSGLEIRTGAR